MMFTLQKIIVFEPNGGFNVIHNHDSTHFSSSFHHLGVYIFFLNTDWYTYIESLVKR